MRATIAVMNSTGASWEITQQIDGATIVRGQNTDLEGRHLDAALRIVEDLLASGCPDGVVVPGVSYAVEAFDQPTFPNNFFLGVSPRP